MGPVSFLLSVISHMKTQKPKKTGEEDFVRKGHPGEISAHPICPTLPPPFPSLAPVLVTH